MSQLKLILSGPSGQCMLSGQHFSTGLFKICQETFHFSRSYKVVSMLTGRCHFLTKITDYDEIGSLQIRLKGRNMKRKKEKETFFHLGSKMDPFSVN
jgi:arylsulfatase A-like enzyme